MRQFKFFITGHKGFETLLHHETRAILDGVDTTVNKVYGGIEIGGGLEAAYRLCLHSRLANRVFCELATAAVEDEQALYQAVYEIEWERHFGLHDSFAVSATVSNSNLDNSHYVALKSKDAIVDRFRERENGRPAVSKKQPDIQIHVHIHRNRASISLDLSGDSLHRRGYRSEHGGAPIKEHLAAALLLQAGWKGESCGALRLLDPMCGSGTFAIEAAMIAADMAPGLRREHYGFLKWRLHDDELWRECLARARSVVVAAGEGRIFASDYDSRVLETARANAARAGVEEWIEFSHQQIAELALPRCESQTLVICNPPYGKRMQADGDLGHLYDDLGEATRRHAPARLAVISANPDLLHRLKLKRLARKDVRNGPLQCLFAQFETVAATQTTLAASPREDAAAQREALSAETLPLYNRLLKNAKRLQRWARRNDISCYRLYDADLPEFSFALDRYQSEISPDLEWFHMQEYQAPAAIDEALAARRIRLASEAVKQAFSVPEDRLYCKIRSRQRGAGQYRKQDNRNEFFQVREGAASLLVNLSDYLDSGLFLDHRVVRQRIYQVAAGKSLLNLFSYTGAIGVQAGLGGAASVTNVDLSQTYLDWARENHALNGLDDEGRYKFIRADIVEMLSAPSRFGLKAAYDLIFFDPPSFSNSKKMRQTLDIQRDHGRFLDAAMRLLGADGTLYFSTNRRVFKLDRRLDEQYDTRDITRATIPEDFSRNPRIHRCWEFRHRKGG